MKNLIASNVLAEFQQTPAPLAKIAAFALID
jgi:hypothetical protein